MRSDGGVIESFSEEALPDLRGVVAAYGHALHRATADAARYDGAGRRLPESNAYTGGALLLGTNIILHFKQKIEYVLSVNEFGDQETQFYVVPGRFFMTTTTVTTTVTWT